MEDRTIKISLKQARKWYHRGDDDLRELAMSVYTEDELKNITHEEKMNYKAILEKFKNHYPLYSVVWSTDGTDNLPNVIVSEPRMIDDPGSFEPKKKVIFDTYRISMYNNEVYKSNLRVSESYNEENFSKGIISAYGAQQIKFSYKDFKKGMMREVDDKTKRFNERIEQSMEEQKGWLKKIAEYQEVTKDFDEKYNSLMEKIKNNGE